jgi:hypothetical protein
MRDSLSTPSVMMCRIENLFIFNPAGETIFPHGAWRSRLNQEKHHA